MRKLSPAIFLVNLFLFCILFYGVLIQERARDKTQFPECYLGRCPQYFSMNVDGDNSSSESVAVIPVTMTKGAGRVLIIKQGEVVFDTEALEDVQVVEHEDGNGITVRSSDKEYKYRFSEGRFLLTPTNP